MYYTQKIETSLIEYVIATYINFQRRSKPVELFDSSIGSCSPGGDTGCSWIEYVGPYISALRLYS